MRLARIAALKAELDALRAANPAGTPNFDHSTDLELTFTSNAIEGNTLTALETTLVIEQGITIGGKPLRDHLEAIDHFEALAYVRHLARHAQPLTENDIRSLHRLVLLRSNPDLAGRYAQQGRYVLTETGHHAFPAPAEIPALMQDFVTELHAAEPGPATAFDAHRRLVDIHPFDDGNGRTARLLMNLLLLQAAYPPVAIRPIDRPAYLTALQQAQAGHGPQAFATLMATRLEASLIDAIEATRILGAQRP